MTKTKNKQLFSPPSERNILIDQIAKEEIFLILEKLKEQHSQYNIQVVVFKKESKKESNNQLSTKVILNLVEKIEDFEYVNSMYLQAEKKITQHHDHYSHLTAFKSVLFSVNCLIKAWWCFFKSKSSRQVIYDIDKLNNHRLINYQNDLSLKEEVYTKIINFFNLYYYNFFLKDVKHLPIIKKSHDFYDEVRLAWSDRYNIVLENKPTPSLIEEYISWSLANQVDQALNNPPPPKYNKI